jgi:ketosteroid isomerase-like protein
MGQRKGTVVLSRRWLLVVAAIAVALVAVESALSRGDGRVPGEVAAINRAYHQAVADADPQAVAGLYARNARYVASTSPPLRGRDAIEEHFVDLFADGLCAFSIGQDRLDVAGRLAVGYGTYSTSICEGGSTRDFGGYYVLVYQRQRDGSLGIKYDIFNAVPSPAVNSPRGDPQ